MELELDESVRAGLESRRGAWQELAKAAGVSHSWISKFVRGEIGNPGFRTLQRLQRAMASPLELEARDAA